MKNNKTYFVIFVLFFLFGGLYFLTKKLSFKPPIRVGVLHSLTGTMAISEKSVVNAVLLAIEQINSKGGLLGRKIQPVIRDGRSDWPTFAKEAEALITQDNVSVIFGCWTSASRKTVKPIFEKYNHLLFYPVQYEGLESSPNIVYTGAAPNQQIIPAVKWSVDHFGQRFFLIGSDYVFPRTANKIIKDEINYYMGEVVGEEYILLGSKDVEVVVQKIIDAKPDVVMNTINGDSNIAFFKELKRRGITSDVIPVMSFSMAEQEIRHMNLQTVVGHYATWNYFQSIDNPENESFVASYKNKYGQDVVVNDPMEAAYLGVFLWAQSVRDAGTDKVNAVRNQLADQNFIAPEGIVSIDKDSQHISKFVRIGQVQQDGQFKIVWSSKNPVKPAPYPANRSKQEWHQFLANLYVGWGNKWANSKDEQ